jgi:SAM-dependent methyltransferase
MNKKISKNLDNKNAMRPFFTKKYTNIFFDILRKFCGGDRFSNLIPYIQEEVYFIKKKLNKKLLFLDYGCGNMNFTLFLLKKKLIHKAVCVDNYIFKERKLVNKNYKYINLQENKNFLKKKFDAAIIIDVLHHIGIKKVDNTLKEICNASRYVIIKDHFEYGYLSRQILRLGDWFGNYGTTINIPKRYFTKKKWELVLKKLKLKQIKIIENVRQHNGIFSLILPSKHQFISIIENRI